MRKILCILGISILLAMPVYANNQKPEKAPNFSPDATWIDTGAAGGKVPHSIKGYRGHVLLVDFWEYTCINCIRDFSVLKRWYAKYHPYGFDIVGVHYGEFAIGFNADNVREAAKRFQLPWPVVADLQGSIWRDYHSNVWPNRFLIDQSGDIVFHVEGEGNDRPLEEKIRELLAAAHPEVNQLPLVLRKIRSRLLAESQVRKPMWAIGSGVAPSLIRKPTRTMEKPLTSTRRECPQTAKSCFPANGSRGRMA